MTEETSPTPAAEPQSTPENPQDAPSTEPQAAPDETQHDQTGTPGEGE